MNARVLVVGGGPAGLAAAGLLARRGLAATVLEAGAYPRNRLCGEFLSPDAERALDALGLSDLTDRLAAPHLTHVRATAASGGRVRATLHAPLPQPGRGVARIDLDAALADAARAAGAEVLERNRVTAVESTEDGVTVATSAGPRRGDALVVATGRLARPLGVSDNAPRSRRWVGVKVHVDGLLLPAVTELHFVRGAYVGLNEVSCGGARRVNVCALARQDLWDESGAAPAELLGAIAARNPAFAERWSAARVVDDTWATAAGFTFARRGATSPVGARPAMVCGDAAALIAPLAGDGQAMALSAGVAAGEELASRRCPEWGLGATAVAEAAEAFARRFRGEMTARLAAGRVLQAALLRPVTAVALVRAASTVRAAPSWLYRATRGPLTGRSGASAGRSS